MLLSLLFALIPLVVSAQLIEERNIEPAEEHLANITSHLTSLNSSVANFPALGGTVEQVTFIHHKFQDVKSATLAGTIEVKYCIPRDGIATEKDGLEFILMASEVGGYIPMIKGMLEQMSAKKPIFESSPIAGVVALFNQDLVDTSSNTTLWLDTLISGTPPVLLAQANQIKSEITTAFTNVLAVYAPSNPPLACMI